MAKDISLLGADYPDVPAVTLPQTGGGTAVFMERGEIESALGQANIRKTVSGGAIISVADGAEDEPMSLKFAIEPVQAGNGDPSPSNVRPISGFDVANVSVTGKNLCTALENGSVSTTSGENSDYSTTQRLRTGWIRVKGNTQYTFNCTGNEITPQIYVIQIDGYHTGNVLITDGWHGMPYTFLTDEDTQFVRISFRGSGNPVITPASVSNVQLEESSTATSYEPIGTTYPITFPTSAGTVYGGTLTVNADGTGELVVDRETVTLTEVSQLTNFSVSETYGSTARLPLANAALLVSDQTCVIGSNCIGIPYDDRTTKFSAYDRVFTNNYNNISIRAKASSNISTVNELFAVFEGGQFVYKLASPVTYTLTPGQVLSILGQNNVWADTGEMEEMTYTADLGIILDGILS